MSEGPNAIKAITVLSFLLMGDDGKGPWMQKAADDLLTVGPVRGENFYFQFFATYAMFRFGGKAWTDWNAMLRDPLVHAQKSGGENDGSWDPDPQHGPYGGRVYQTALGALTLEFYYGVLPVFEK